MISGSLEFDFEVRGSKTFVVRGLARFMELGRTNSE